MGDLLAPGIARVDVLGVIEGLAVDVLSGTRQMIAGICAARA
jgi:hypothetical protein